MAFFSRSNFEIKEKRNEFEWFEIPVLLVTKMLNTFKFFFCLDVVPVNTNPAVNASLENKIFDINGFQSLEPVFKCLFDEPDGSPYWYDTYWYINTDTVKVVESQLYMSNQSWLYPTDWVQKYNLNMVVRYHLSHSCIFNCIFFLKYLLTVL